MQNRDTIDQIKSNILACWENNEVPLLVSSKGTGKTSIVQQLVKQKNMELVFYNLPLGFGEQYLEGLVRNLTKCSENKTQSYVLFFDNISKMSPDDFDTFLEIVKTKRIGDFEIPNNVSIISAAIIGIGEGDFTFNAKDKISDLKKHFTVIEIKIEKITKCWLNYARNNKFHPYVIQFIEKFPEYLHYTHDVETTMTLDHKNWAVPLSWETVSKSLIYMRKNGLMDDQLVDTIGPYEMGIDAYNAFKDFVLNK